MDTPTDVRHEVEQLRIEINNWDFRYYVQCAGAPPDSEYDEAKDRLKELLKQYPQLEDPNCPTQRVGAPLLGGTQEVEHKSKMLSLEKVTTVEALIKFFGNQALPGIIEPKIDGASLSVHYINGRLVQAVTRGDGEKGQDVTHCARTIKTLPIRLERKLNIEVRGEVVICWSAFNKMNEEREAEGEELAKNPRNAAAGALGLLDPTEAAKVPLTFVAYQILGDLDEFGIEGQADVLELLEELHFLTSSALPKPLDNSEAMCQHGFALNNRVEIRDWVERLDKARKVQDFATDGLVFKVDDLAVQQELGVAKTCPRWAVAYKYKPDRASTTIKQIIWTVGKTGKVTPVGFFEPVLLSGSTIAKASLCNRDEIKRLNVNVGDVVEIEKSNEVIPKVMALVAKHSRGPARAPDKCPACGSKVTEFPGYVDVFCVNPCCKAQAQAKLEYAVGKHGLDIDGCGPQAIALCMQNGIKTLPELLKETSFAFFKGAARKKMQLGVAKAFEAPRWRKLAALCIESWGRETCQAVATRWATFDHIIDASDNQQLPKVIGEDKASSFNLFLKAWKEELMALTEIGYFNETAEESNGLLGGKSFCITGSIPGCSDRYNAEDEIRKRGGTVKGSVTRKLDILVVGENPGQVKLTAARRWGTRCITPEQLFELMGGWNPHVDASVKTPKEK